MFKEALDGEKAKAWDRRNMETVSKNQLKVFAEAGNSNMNCTYSFSYNLSKGCIDNLVTSLVIVKERALGNGVIRKDSVK